MARNWKIGYCINCDARDLYELGCERVYADTSASERHERTEAFRAIREGDTLTLLSRSHMGKGKEVPRLIALAERMGVTVEIHDDKPVRTVKRKPGPPSTHSLNYAQERRVRHYWHGTQKRSVAMRLIEEAVGAPVSVHWLNRKIGPRSKPRPWMNEKPKKEQT